LLTRLWGIQRTNAVPLTVQPSAEWRSSMEIPKEKSLALLRERGHGDQLGL
jgi:hypothetical protein